MSIVCVNEFYVKGAWSHILAEKPREKSRTDSRCWLAQPPFPDLLSSWRTEVEAFVRLFQFCRLFVGSFIRLLWFRYCEFQNEEYTVVDCFGNCKVKSSYVEFF